MAKAFGAGRDPKLTRGVAEGTRIARAAVAAVHPCPEALDGVLRAHADRGMGLAGAVARAAAAAGVRGVEAGARGRTSGAGVPGAADAGPIPRGRILRSGSAGQR